MSESTTHTIHTTFHPSGIPSEITPWQASGARVYIVYRKEDASEKAQALADIAAGTSVVQTEGGGTVVYLHRKEAERQAGHVGPDRRQARIDSDYHVRSASLYEVIEAAGDTPVYVRVN